MRFGEASPPRRPSSSGKVQRRRGLLGLGLCVAALGLFYSAGCQEKEGAKQAAMPVAKSIVEVKISGERVTLRPPSVEFVLSPSGALRGSLLQGGTFSTLDAKSLDS